MGTNKLPSPVQPPVAADATGDVAHVQHTLNGPVPAYIGRPERRRTEGNPFPLFLPESSKRIPSYHDRRLPPMQQQVVQPPPSSQQRSFNPEYGPGLSINSLLSTDPSSSKEQYRSRSSSGHSRSLDSYDVNYSPLYHSSPSSYFGLPNDARPTLSFPPLPPPPPPPPASSHHEARQAPPTTPNIEPSRSEPSPATTVRSIPTTTHTHSSEASPRPSEQSSRASIASEAERPIISPPPALNYTLHIRQQPHAARACGFGERDRRVIDPPPILELQITDPATGATTEDPYAMLALHCTLLSADGKSDCTADASPATRRLMGTLVASPYAAKDTQGVAGNFFVFSDLSCRYPGRYKLLWRLLRVDPALMMPGAIHRAVGSIESEVFEVFVAKDFPGMKASTPLLATLRNQGLAVSLKKGARARGLLKRKSTAESDGEDEEEESEGSGDSEIVVSRKKGKGKRAAVAK